jgi:hypothetical protein
VGEARRGALKTEARQERDDSLEINRLDSLTLYFAPLRRGFSLANHPKMAARAVPSVGAGALAAMAGTAPI